MNDHDRILLLDIVDAAENAMAFLGPRSLEEFGADLMRRMAVERCIEIVGEASGKFSAAFKQEHGPRLPIKEAVKTRNRFIHGYRTVSYSIVYDTVVHDLPGLVAELKAILKDAP